MTSINYLIDESIKVELYVAKLYEMFSEYYSCDTDFWWQLSVEEKRHAALLSRCKTMLVPEDLVPDAFSQIKIADIEKTNQYLESLIQRYQLVPPDRKEALLEAQRIEDSAVELHLQNMTNDSYESPLIKAFVELNGEDKDHSKRIQEYIRDNFDH